MLPLGLVGLALAGVLTVPGCALLWRHVDDFVDYDDAELWKRQMTADVFDYVYLLLFGVLAAAGRMRGHGGATRVGLLGLAALVVKVHSLALPFCRPAYGQGWDTANTFRLAMADKDSVYHDALPPTGSGNEHMFAGMTLLFIASFLALLAAGHLAGRSTAAATSGSSYDMINSNSNSSGGSESRPLSTATKVWFGAAAALAFAAIIAVASSSYMKPQHVGGFAKPTDLYFTAFVLLSAAVVTTAVLGAGLALDVPEYVAVAAFYASQGICYALVRGLNAESVYFADTADHPHARPFRAGLALVFATFVCVLAATVAHMVDRASVARDYVAGADASHVHVGLLVLAVLCVLGGSGALFSICGDLAKSVAFDDPTPTDEAASAMKAANVLEVLAYIFLVAAAVAGRKAAVVAAQAAAEGGSLVHKLFSSSAAPNSAWRGLTSVMAVAVGAGWFVLSAGAETFSWSTGNVFRKASTEHAASHRREYISEAAYDKVTFADDSDNRVYMAGFVLVHLAAGLAMLSLVLPEATDRSRSRSRPLLALAAAAGCMHIISGLVVATSPSASSGNLYYLVFFSVAMVSRAFFLAAFVLLGVGLAAQEFVWLAVIATAVQGLQQLPLGFYLALNIHNNKESTHNQGDGVDRALASGALGFIAALLTLLAAAAYLNRHTSEPMARPLLGH